MVAELGFVAVLDFVFVLGIASELRFAARLGFFIPDLVVGVECRLQSVGLR